MTRTTSERKRQEAADLFRSLANANRLAILCALRNRPRAVGELEKELQIRQPILSQQLAILREAGIVGTRREQKSVTYFLREQHVQEVTRILQAALGDTDAPCASLKSGPPAPPARRLHEAAVFARVEPA